MAVANPLTGRDSQRSRRVLAGTTVTPNTPVGFESTNGFIDLAYAATGSAIVCAGFPETSGAGTKVPGSGIFTHVNLNVHGVRQDASWSWTLGGPIYVAGTAGAAGGLTQTAPNTTGDFIQQVGTASASDEMLIDIHAPNWVGD
jgi:hypothetical protein